MYRKIILLLIILFSVCDICISQNRDSTVYESVIFLKHRNSSKKTKTVLILYSDSTYKWIIYKGEISDDNTAYLNWKNKVRTGRYVNDKKNFLLVKFGNNEAVFKRHKNFVKYEWTQNSIGEEKEKFDKEKRIKLKLIKTSNSVVRSL
ncbi:MAG TPA: hypothetical protein PKI01_06190 [Bacteroidales bacterium]|nr:hypothetical protein [Bacteroidales bacterium]